MKSIVPKLSITQLCRKNSIFMKFKKFIQERNILHNIKKKKKQFSYETEQSGIRFKSRTTKQKIRFYMKLRNLFQKQNILHNM